MEESMRRLLYYTVSFAVIFGSFFGVLKAADYAGFNDSKAVNRYTMHEYYEQDNIDVLFLGSSQAFYSVDCGIMDEKLGKNTFVLGTGSQRLNLTAFLLKDAAARYDLEHVYVYLSYRQAAGTFEKGSLEEVVYITDGLRSVPDKLMLTTKLLTPELYMNALLPVRRNLDALFKPKSVASTLSIKSTSDYKNYNGQNIVPSYMGKGHFEGTKVVEQGTMVSVFTPDPLSIDSITDTWRESFKEIVDFCEKEGIDLTFFAPPISSCVLLALENQDSLIQEVNSMLEGTDFEFVDFSLLKKEYWPDDSGLFNDTTHVNKTGSEIFSELFADYINGDLSTDEIFYGSVRERFEDLDPAFYGASTKSCSLPEGPGKEYHLLGNPAEKMEYKVDLDSGDGQIIPLQDYDKNDRINISNGNTGFLKVSARLEGEEEPFSEVEIELQ